MQVGLAERINASMPVVTEAVRFACFARVLAVEADGRIRVGSQKLKKSAIDGLGEGPARALKHAERLGYWFAMAGSTRLPNRPPGDPPPPCATWPRSRSAPS